MTCRQLETLPGVRLLQAAPEGEIEAAYTSDLLSDVMGNCPADSVLITIQGHKNTVAVATLAGVKAILLANNAPAASDMLAAAAQEDVAVLVSPENQFTLSWRVAALLGLG